MGGSPGRQGGPIGPWRGFLAAHSQLVRRLDADLRRDHGLGLREFEVLLFLERAGGRVRMAELQRRLPLTYGGLSQLIGRLEVARWVVRERDEEDGRGRHAVLTPEGATLLAAALPTHEAGVQDGFFARLTPEQLDCLAEAWERLLGA
jgi:DNA-binding MarR family transcriptional regulator